MITRRTELAANEGTERVEQVFVTRIEIESTPSEVMAFLRRPENWLLFAAGVVDCSPRGEILAVGTKGSWTRKQGPSKVVNEFEVLELEPDKTLVMRVAAPGVQTVDRTELQGVAGGTEATFTETMTIDSLPMQAMMWLMRPLIRRNLDKTYEALKQALEAPTS